MNPVWNLATRVPPSDLVRRCLQSTGHVAGLWALVVAQPVLFILGRAPEFFVAHRADTLDLLIVATLVVAVAPLACGAVIGVASRAGQRAADAVTALFVGLLVALEVAQVGYRLGVSGWTATSVIALAGLAIAATVWWRSAGVRHLLTVLSASVLVVPLVFLSTGGIRSLLVANPTQVGARQPSQLPPVVLIVFDELPLVSLLDEHGRLDATRYPNIAALAADGVWFRNATTVSDFTRWALPAILTGQYPRAGSVPTPADHPDSLFTWLATTHRMEVIEPLTALCPPQLAGKPQVPRVERQRRMYADLRVVASYVLLPPAARTDLPDVTEGWAGFADEDDEFRRVWRAGERLDPQAMAVSFIDDIGATDEQPTLYFMHTLVSHHPPRWLPSGQAIANFVTPPGMLRSMVWTTSSWPVALFEQGALVQAGLVDTLVGRLRARLQAAGLYDRALVVVTADHGMSFTPGSRIRSFSEAGAGGIVPVPLIVKLPADRQALAPGTIDDHNVETIDILPTIADGIGKALRKPVDGVSALRERPLRAGKQVYFDQARQVRTFEPDEIARLRDREAARKAATFGTAPWPAPSPSGLGVLVGRPLESLTISEEAQGPRLQIDNLFAFDGVDLAGPALPVQVKGRVLGLGGRAAESVHLAIALNGTVAATTRTWSESGSWLALLQPDRLQEGRNDLRVFTVDPARPTVLSGTRVSRGIPPGLNLMSAEAPEYGVAYRGFYHRETAGSTPFHWTQAESTITVPLAEGRTPAVLDLEVLSAGPQAKRLRILVDECEVSAETVPPGRWSKSIPVGTCAPRGRWMTIRLLAETHRPGGTDKRRLGVALSRVVLRD